MSQLTRMLYSIRHRTVYHFDRAVFLEPHRLLLKPIQSHRQQLRDYSIRIDPLPAGHTHLIDAENNPAQLIWFDGQHEYLEIEVVAEVTVPAFNPFDFLVHPPECALLGFSYPPGLGDLLRPYMMLPGRSRSLRQKLAAIRQRTGEELLGFITGTLEDLHGSIERIVREEGAPFTPDQTLRSEEGSCRDIALLHMTLMREVGIASRFASGYLYHHGEEEDHELHAWTEVYLPGAGWLGTDPSLGLWSQGDHITLATSALPAGAMPVTGTYRGDAAAAMEATVHITRLD